MEKQTTRGLSICVLQNTDLGSSLPLSVYLTDLFRNTKVGNNKIQIIASKSQKIPREIFENGIDVIEVKSDLYTISGNFLFTFLAFKKLCALHKTERIDILHALYPNSSLIAALLYKLFKNFRVKIIYDIRSPWIEMMFERGHVKKTPFTSFFEKVLYFFERALSWGVDSFVFITKELATYYQKKIGQKSLITVIPSGVDTKMFIKTSSSIREQRGFSENDIVLGVVGSLAKVRQLDFIVKAFTELHRQDPRYKLYFIGDGDERERLEGLVKNLGISSAVYFEGRVPHNEIPKYISSFDIGICHIPDLFVFRQSFPLKILEYLSCGIPVIASDIPANREISLQNNNIYLYSFSTSSFVRLVKKYIDEKMSFIELKDFTKRYDWNNLAKQYLDVYTRA